MEDLYAFAVKRLRVRVWNDDAAAPDLSTPMSLAQMPQSPLSAAGQRRRMRVSSLPSATPTVEKGYPLIMMNGHGHGETLVGAVAVGGGGGAMRTTLHETRRI